ncbi:MAG: hypothetical protein AAGB51_01460 [Planctomycetota bacterium]
MTTPPAPTAQQRACPVGVHHTQISDSPWTSTKALVGAFNATRRSDLPLAIAEALADLGLLELSAAWVKAAPPPPEYARRLSSLAERLKSMPPAMIPPQQRAETANRNIASLDNEDAAPLRAAFDAWRVGDETITWFRASDGSHTGMRAGRAINDPEALVRFRSGIDLAAALDLPPNRPEGSRPPRPLILQGIAAGAHIARIHEAYQPLDFGRIARLYAVEPDTTAALDALAELDLTTPLGFRRLRFIAGVDAAERTQAVLESSIGHWSELSFVSGGMVAEPLDLPSRLKRLAVSQADEFKSLCARNTAAYAARDAAWFAERFAQHRGSRPLRVLAATTRFTTYVQHAASDITAAFEALGADTHLLIEPDDSSTINGLHIARAVRDHDPDLLVTINYPRSHLEPAVPAGLPCACWIQDSMAHLFDRATGESIGPLDVAVGNIHKSFVTDHGYPARGCLRFGVPASVAKFRGGCERDDLACDVLIATNHSEPPQQMAARLESELCAASAPPGLGAALCEATAQALDEWRSGWLEWLLEDAAGAVFDRFGIQPKSDTANRLHQSVLVPYANRVLRHRMIGWALELAKQGEATVRIHGRGWDDAGPWAGYVHGPLVHGADLRDAYASAAVTLHTSASWVTHQRIYECLLAGGLPAVMLKPDDAAHALRPARNLAERLKPTCCRLADRLHCVQAVDHPITAGSVAAMQRIARPEMIEADTRGFSAAQTLRDGLIPCGTGDLSTNPDIAESEPAQAHIRLLHLLSMTAFASAEELADVIKRVREDSAHRRGITDAASHLIEGHFSYESAARSVRELLENRAKTKADRESEESQCARRAS